MKAISRISIKKSITYPKHNQIHFITVIDITDNIPVESKCQTQSDAFAGEDVTVCVCSGNFCNQALQIQLTMYPLLITLILTALLP